MQTSQARQDDQDSEDNYLLTLDLLMLKHQNDYSTLPEDTIRRDITKILSSQATGFVLIKLRVLEAKNGDVSKVQVTLSG